MNPVLNGAGARASLQGAEIHFLFSLGSGSKPPAGRLFLSCVTPSPPVEGKPNVPRGEKPIDNFILFSGNILKNVYNVLWRDADNHDKCNTASIWARRRAKV